VLTTQSYCKLLRKFLLLTITFVHTENGKVVGQVCERYFNPLNAELNPICHLLALLGGATIVVVSRLRVKLLNRIFTKHVVVLLLKIFRESTGGVRKVKIVCAYNPRSCFIVPDQSFGVFSRV
jgi:hypothetical protein